MRIVTEHFNNANELATAIELLNNYANKENDPFVRRYITKALDTLRDVRDCAHYKERIWGLCFICNDTINGQVTTYTHEGCHRHEIKVCHENCQHIIDSKYAPQGA